MISVIVAIYNISSCLETCIRSITAQSYENLEIILVDDGSTDNSGEICDAYALTDSRIKTIHKKNGGLVSARQAGLAAARGEYIAFADGDDWMEPDMYRHLYEAAVSSHADMALSGYIEDTKGHMNNKLNTVHVGIYDRERMEKELYPCMLCKGDFLESGVQPYIWNKLIRKELACRHIPSIDRRIRVGEDAAAVMPMLLMADKIVVTDNCDYHYCIRETSMIRKRESDDREWKELWILHHFLKEKMAGRQLNHYTITNMLTRTYARLAAFKGGEILWPFLYRLDGQSCIVYSAGNFGRAVYEYLANAYPGKVCLWVDREYEKYQRLGLPVYGAAELARYQNADILVAVMSHSAAESIQTMLLSMGVEQKRIYKIQIAEEEVREIMSGEEQWNHAVNY